MWGFPKIRGTILGVLIFRIIVYWGLYWGSPYFGKLPCRFLNDLALKDSQILKLGSIYLEDTTIPYIEQADSLLLSTILFTRYPNRGKFGALGIHGWQENHPPPCVVRGII